MSWASCANNSRMSELVSGAPSKPDLCLTVREYYSAVICSVRARWRRQTEIQITRACAHDHAAVGVNLMLNHPPLSGTRSLDLRIRSIPVTVSSKSGYLFSSDDLAGYGQSK